jgi:hypothetical protein
MASVSGAALSSLTVLTREFRVLAGVVRRAVAEQPLPSRSRAAEPILEWQVDRPKLAAATASRPDPPARGRPSAGHRVR